jgi:hypothetical protein
MSGEVWGGNKVATWKAFLREIAELGLSTKANQDDRGMWLEFPTSKGEAFQRMAPADGGGWSLWYRFHS